MRKVFVVSFQPFEDRSSVGGFEWRYRRQDADVEFDTQQQVAESYGGVSVVRLVEVTVASGSAHGITQELDGRLEEIEITLPALREYVPREVAI